MFRLFDINAPKFFLGPAQDHPEILVRQTGLL